MATVDDWMRRYFAAWRSNDPDDVGDLFSADALYAVGPFAEPWRGRREIAERWTAGDGRLIRSRHELLSERPARAIVHWNVVMQLPGGEHLEEDGVLLLDFDADGRCAVHREWFAARTF